MAQVDDYTIPASPLTMAGLKTALESIFSALVTINSGSSAPDNPVEGMLWWDTSGDPTELLKRYTVAMGWVTLLSVNNTTGVVIPYRSGAALGTMATATATDYITKALFNAQTILAAVDDDVPAAVEIAAQRVVGRKTGGNIAGLTLSEVLDMIGSATEGDILYRGSAAWARLAKGTALQWLRQNSGATAPEWATLTEAGITLADNTTGNVSTTKHGLAPKAPNDTTKFLRGDATWAVPLQYVKALVTFDGTGSSSTVAAQVNVASVTDNGTGDYTINFTSALSSADYMVAGMSTAQYAIVVSIKAAKADEAPTTKTTGAVRVVTGSGSALFDAKQVTVIICQ